MGKKIDPNKAWADASAYSRKKFGTDLTQIIADRDTSTGESKIAAQDMINEAYGLGGKNKSSEMTAQGKRHLVAQKRTVQDAYNEKVDQNARARMKVANDMLDKTGEATIDVLEGGQQAMAKMDAIKRKRKSSKKQMYAGD